MNCVKFTKEFEVYYHELDKRYQANLTSIINYLQETAIAHSESIGYGVGRLLEDGVGWVLNKWLIMIEKYPKWGERILVETWASSFERFHATREFYIKDSQGNTIGKATSLWIFLNIDKKRPARIPEKISQSYGFSEERAVNEAFKDICGIDEPEYTKEFHIRRSEIDTNNHVNNTKYIEWMLESIPHEIYEDYVPSSIEIVYKKETTYGESILSNCKTLQFETGNNEMNHSIINEKDGKELALARTLWRKR